MAEPDAPQAPAPPQPAPPPAPPANVDVYVKLEVSLMADSTIFQFPAVLTVNDIVTVGSMSNVTVRAAVVNKLQKSVRNLPARIECVTCLVLPVLIPILTSLNPCRDLWLQFKPYRFSPGQSTQPILAMTLDQFSANGGFFVCHYGASGAQLLHQMNALTGSRLSFLVVVVVVFADRSLLRLGFSAAYQVVIFFGFGRRIARHDQLAKIY